MNKSDRVILHSDLNGFYASVECFENPRIKNYPVAVCGSQELRHGIVLAKNEIAKEFTNKYTDTKKEHIADKLMQGYGIDHKLIKPRTPRHNGK